MVTVYLHGHELDPAAITALVGVQPTKSWSKGHRHKTSSGKEIIRKEGLWTLASVSTSQLLKTHLTDLKGAFGHWRKSLMELPGVESAYLDIYVSARTKTISTHLEFDDLKFICDLGLELEFTTSVDED
jgi:hypothetical protein